MQQIKIYDEPQIEVTLNSEEVVVNVQESGTAIEVVLGGQLIVWGEIEGNISNQPDLYNALNSKVNDSGDTMTGDLNFTNSGINQTDYVEFNTGYTDGIVEGRLQWNSTDGHLEVGLAGSDILGDTTPGMVRVVNKTGSVIGRGKVIYINGGQGNRPTITLASNANETTSSKTFGVTAEEIGVNQNGWVLKFGFLYNVNTNGYTAGQVLYLGTNGNITGTKPSAPNHMVAVGKVINVSSTVGTIYVEIQNGFELQELHNVAINSVANNQFIRYNSTSGLWENVTLQKTTSDPPANLISNGGTTLTDTDTFDGYTLKQVVRALRDLKFLA